MDSQRCFPDAGHPVNYEDLADILGMLSGGDGSLDFLYLSTSAGKKGRCSVQSAGATGLPGSRRPRSLRLSVPNYPAPIPVTRCSLDLPVCLVKIFTQAALESWKCVIVRRVGIMNAKMIAWQASEL